MLGTAFSVILCALAASATSAVAAEEDSYLLKIKAEPTEKALRAALPAGASSTTIVLSCLASADRLTQCVVRTLRPSGPPAIGDAAIKLVDAVRIDRKDMKGAPTEGRRFAYQMEMLAPGDRDPDWLRKPSPSSLAAVLPLKAVQNRQPGAAVIACRVTVEGYLDRCQAASEAPAGYGFGAAALALAPQFAFTPKIRGGKAVEGSAKIPILWPTMPVGPFVSNDRVVGDLNWVRTPSAAAVAAAYPVKAADVPSGQAALRCRLDDAGKTKFCEVTSEIPTGKGFGAAAKALAPAFVADFTPEERPLLKTLRVDIPFRFRNPANPDTARLTDPRWTRMLSPEGAALIYPKQAREAGVMKGLSVVDCMATDQGALADCRIVREEPTGLGFGTAALEATKVMRMNPWTKTGDPVEGRRFNLPITLAWEPEAPEANPPAPKP